MIHYQPIKLKHFKYRIIPIIVEEAIYFQFNKKEPKILITNKTNNAINNFNNPKI